MHTSSLVVVRKPLESTAMDIKLFALCAIIVLLGTASSQSFEDMEYEDFQPYIINGTVPRNITDFNYMALLIITQPPSSMWKCAATIISDTWVLTTAHCLQTKDPSHVLVFPRFPVSGSLMSQASNIVFHPDYNGTDDKDIAMVQMRVPLTFSEIVGNISIKNESVSEGINCTVVGYGKNTTDGGQPGELHYNFVLTKPTAECKRATEGQLCAESIAPGHVLCSYDIGDPLVCDFELTGIAVYDDNCGAEKNDVYIDITKLKDWIELVLEENPPYTTTPEPPTTTTTVIIPTTTPAVTNKTPVPAVTTDPTTTASASTFPTHISLISILVTILAFRS